MAEGRKRVLVYGATGSQAAPVARRLLEEGWHIRVLSRDPGKAGWLAEAGAEVIEGDMGAPESLREASAGMDAVFLLVPFFVGSPDAGEAYGKNAVDAAREAGVGLIVWNASGEIPPEKTGNPGFDLRIEVLEHLRDSGVPYIALEPTAYMENFLGPWTAPEVAEKDVFAYPTPNEVKMQWVATDDVAAFAVEALGRPELNGNSFKVCGPERLNGEEISARFGAALGREVSFRPMPPKEFGGILDDAFGPGAGEAAARGYEMAYQNPEMFSTNIDVSPTLEKLPVELTTLESWVRQHREIFSHAPVR